jgi:hypothetical protein
MNDLMGVVKQNAFLGLIQNVDSIATDSESMKDITLLCEM